MPTPDDAVTVTATAELSELLLNTDEFDQYLRQLVSCAAGDLGGGVSCGLTVSQDDRPIITASSDDTASMVDQLQHGPSPGLSGMLTGETQLIEDMATDERWADFRMRALAHGVRSSLSIPLPVEGRPVGLLNFYSRHSHAFGARERATAQRYVAEATRMVALAVRMAQRLPLREHLAAALASRAVVDQAIGVIMSQRQCTAAEASDLLRTIAQTRNVKCSDVATEIVTAVGGTAPRG